MQGQRVGGRREEALQRGEDSCCYYFTNAFILLQLDSAHVILDRHGDGEEGGQGHPADEGEGERDHGVERVKRGRGR